MQWLKNNTLIVGGAGVLVLILGFWLAVIHPKQQANEACNSAVQLLRQETSDAETLRKEAERFALWYKSEYLVPIVDLLKKSDEKIAQANASVKKAESANTDEKYAFATKAIEYLQKGDGSVSSLLSAVKQELDGYTKMTADTRGNLLSLQDKVSKMGSAHNAAQGRYILESGAYLPKYTKVMEGELSKADKLLWTATKALDRAARFLPPDDDTTKLGDPKAARSELSSAEDVLGQGYVFVNNVIRELSFQKEALENVVQAITDASVLSQQAEEHLSFVGTNSKLSSEKSLKSAYAKYRDSSDLLKKAKKTLRTKVEGKYDNPLAYKSALESIENAKAATIEADAQVRLMNEAANGIRQLRAEVENTSNLLRDAHVDIGVLKQYHQERLWQDVSGHAEKISSQIRQAEKALAKAEAYADLNVERFSDAVVLIHSGIDSVGQAQAFSIDLHDFLAKLEKAREMWPDAYRSAQSQIDSERMAVHTYGSYSSSAKSDFERAVGLLRDARNAAKDRDYKKAVSLAQSAKKYADGTGSKARRAYNEYQDEQAAKKRAEENAKEKQNTPPAKTDGEKWTFSKSN